MSENRCYGDVCRYSEWAVKQQNRLKNPYKTFRARSRRKLSNRLLPTTKSMMIICLSCGKKMGDLTYIEEDSFWNPMNTFVVCNACFKAKIGKMVIPKDPFNMMPEEVQEYELR